MVKSKSKLASHMPKAPWIYIDDCSASHEFASKLASMIPKTVHLKLTQCPSRSPELLADITDARWNDTVIVLSRSQAESGADSMMQSVNALKEASIKSGNNFASIRIYPSDECVKASPTSSHHLDIKAASRPSSSSLSNVKVTAYAMYKWLFSVFTVLEQLHLIADRQMTAVDRSPAFKDYAYCPISLSRKHPKNGKIQFVALVMSKPTIGPNQRLHWQVADKTGVANFYFQYKGPASQYTWDWVLALKPGDRKCLPRMPMVEVKESSITTIVKAPFRVSAAFTNTTGETLKAAGGALCRIGSKLKLGERRKWVPENEHHTNATIDTTHGNPSSAQLRTHFKNRSSSGEETAWKNKSYGSLVPAQEKTEVWIFSEKGEKVWRDDDSVASTEAGSISGGD